jgi:hypothetical protein
MQAHDVGLQSMQIGLDTVGGASGDEGDGAARPRPGLTEGEAAHEVPKPACRVGVGADQQSAGGRR